MEPWHSFGETVSTSALFCPFLYLLTLFCSSPLITCTCLRTSSSRLLSRPWAFPAISTFHNLDFLSDSLHRTSYTSGPLPHISHLVLILPFPILLSTKTLQASFHSRFLTLETTVLLFPQGSLHSQEKSWHLHTLNPHQTGSLLPVFPCPTGFQASSPTFCFPGFRCLLPTPQIALLSSAYHQDIPPSVRFQGQSCSFPFSLLQLTSSTRFLPLGSN